MQVFALQSLPLTTRTLSTNFHPEIINQTSISQQNVGDSYCKILRMLWNIQTDVLKLRSIGNIYPNTKREYLAYFFLYVTRFMKSCSSSFVGTETYSTRVMASEHRHWNYHHTTILSFPKFFRNIASYFRRCI